MSAAEAHAPLSHGDRPVPEAHPLPMDIVLFLALLACVPLLGTLFGYGNQVEQFSIIARLRDPAFLAGDFYVDSAARFGPRIYYARALAWLSGTLPLPLVVHGLATLCNFALGAVTYFAATRLLGSNRLGGALAALFVVTNGSFSLGLAGYLRFDSFQPANIAVPLALIGMVALIRLHPFVALGPFILAALAHPLIGMEVALIAYGAAGLAIWIRPPSTGALRALILMGISGLAFGAIMYLAWALPLSENTSFRLDDAEFFDILAAFRAPHHYLGLSFPTLAWTQALIFITGTGIVLVHHLYKQGIRRETLALVLAALAVLILCAASLWFVDVMQSRLWVTAQIFRMLMLVKWVGLLAFGWVLADWIIRDRPAGLIMAGCIALATADAQPYAIGFVLISIGALLLGPRWIAPRLWAVLRWIGLAMLILLTAAANYRYGIAEQSLRGALALSALLLIATPRFGRPIGAISASLLVAVALTATLQTRDQGLFGLKALQTQLIWSDLKGDEVEIARAAADLSRAEAIWLVPPTFEAFRLHAGRPVVVDYTSIPFGDAAMREWRARVQGIYGPLKRGGFGALGEMRRLYRAGEINWEIVASQYSASYAVLFSDTPWQGPVLYENDSYKAVRIMDAEN